jgi:hypothetical protein
VLVFDHFDRAIENARALELVTVVPELKPGGS